MPSAVRTSHGLPRLDGEERALLRDVSWEQYEAILEASGDSGAPRFAYLDGDLEIMSPSPLHETRKKLLARLVEAFAEERGIELGALGSTTFRRKAKKRGAEPDECYVRGAIDARAFPQVPELVIEVAISPWRLDRLAIYASLRVKELWLWHDEALQVFTLRAGGRYSRARRSTVLPALDLALLTRFARRGDQTAAVREFRAAVRSR
ncbi:MAG TPA: Uma2 family endonuclease [Polyangiaceae bacterium]